MRIIFLLCLFLPFPASATCDVYGNCDEPEISLPFFSQEEPVAETPDIEPSPAPPEKTIDGTVSLDTDRFGQVRGNIGDSAVNLSENRLGGLTGTIGGENKILYKNQLGGLTGHVGDKNVRLYEDRTGMISGHIGDQRVTCYENRIGQTACH